MLGRRRIALAAGVVVVLLLWGSGAGQAQTANLAAGRPAAAASEDAAYPAALAVDGLSGTVWRSAAGGVQWLAVDLGSVFTVRRVVATWGAAYAMHAAVHISTDGVNYTTAATTERGTGQDTFWLSHPARYIAIVALHGVGPVYELAELAVYGDPPACPRDGCPSPAATATATASPSATPTATATPAGCGRGGCPSPTASPAATGTPCPRGGCPTPAATASPSPTATPPVGQAQRWSDPRTWGGSLPGAGASVTIPTGITVLLDISPPPLAGLTVDGMLVFDRRDLTLMADWIMVHGRFEVGTAAAPFTQRAVITLTAADTNQSIMNMGTKLLGVMGGTLELHGEPRTGWTRLSQTAAAGSATLTLESAPPWRAGDRLVLASTDYDPAQAEEVTIAAISGNVVTLAAPVKNLHWGQDEVIDGVTVSERAEVGLLSRNILIQGDAASETAGFGAQVMVMAGSMAHVHGVELYRAGQRARMGRYPFHWHMAGDMTGSSFGGNSIHHTYNRCLTVHGTHNVTVRGNVAYDAPGHCYFFEDGVERGATMEGNLGLLTRRPATGQALLPSDQNPATFWITNPDNTIRDNVAAGSHGFGFWIALPEHPTGLSKNATNDALVWPRRTPLREFARNTAHSNDVDGLHADSGPRADGTTESTFWAAHQNPIPPPSGQPDSAIVPVTFDRFIGYRNRNRAVWLRGHSHTLSNALLADNGAGATFASVDSFLERSTVIGETANKGQPRSWEVRGLDGRTLPRFWDVAFPIRGFEFYDGRVGARDSSFVNFQPNSQRQAGGIGFNRSNRFALDPRNLTERLRFVNANRVYIEDPLPNRDGDRSALFQDVDGSVTGAAGTQVVVDNPFLLTPDCAYVTAWNAWTCTGAYGRLIIQNRDGVGAAFAPVDLRREGDGAAQPLVGTSDDLLQVTYVHTALLVNGAYTADFGGVTPGKVRVVLQYRPLGDWVRLALPAPAADPYVYRDYSLSTRVARAATLAELDASMGDRYYVDTAAGLVYIKVRVNAANRDWGVIDVCARDRCP